MFYVAGPDFLSTRRGRVCPAISLTNCGFMETMKTFLSQPRLSIVLVCVLVVISASTTLGATADDAVVFAPQQYTRTTGNPNQYTSTFPLPAWVNGPFHLRVQNGNANGANRVSSASIRLNGEQVVSSENFEGHEDRDDHKAQDGVIVRSVHLRDQNTLQITVGGKQGSFFVVTILGQNADHTPPIINIVAPALNADINNPVPRIAVTYKDPLAKKDPPVEDDYDRGKGDDGNRDHKNDTDNRPQLVASGVDVNSLQVLLDGVDRTSLFTRRSGDASADLPASLALLQGNHVLQATIKDFAGNVAHASSQFTVDLTPPQLQILQPLGGSFLANPKPAITLQYQDNIGLDLATFRVSINGQDQTAIFNKTATGATATLSSALPNGANHIVAQISDLAGNQTTTTAAFNIDTTPPVIAISHPLNGSFLNTLQAAIAVQYSDDQALDLSTLQIVVDGNQLPVNAGASAGTALANTPVQGSHSIVATIRDKAGNLATATSSFTIDTTAPAIHILAPASGALLNFASPVITVGYADNDIDITTLHVLINGIDRTQLFTIQPGSATVDLKGKLVLPEGLVTVAAQINDLAGNTGSAGFSFTIDTIAPVASFQFPRPQINSNTPLITLSYSDSGTGVDPASVHVSLDGADITASLAVGPNSTAGTLVLTPPLADGTHQLQATLADRAGNRATTSSSFVVDTIPPVAGFASPADNSFTNNSTPALRLTYSDVSGTGVDVNSIHVFLKHAGDPETEVTSLFQIGAQEAGGTVSANSPLGDATYRLRAQVNDVAGNTTTATSTFEVDTVAPTYRIESPADSSFTNKSTPAIVIDYQDDRSGVDTARLAVLVDGVDKTARFTVGAAQATGTLQAQDALADGPHQITVRVFDRAGNQAPVLAQSFTVDTVPPTITPVFTPAPNAAGWNNTPVTISFNCGDPASDLAACPAPITVATEGIQAIPVTVTDSAGNSTTINVAVRVDLTPPVVTALAAPPANVDGWNNTDVQVSFQCADSVSGVVSCPAIQTVSAEGASQPVTGTAVDVAGNTATATVNLNIDKTPPTISASVSPLPNANGIVTAASATVSFTCSDNLSGIVNCPSPVTVTQQGLQTISGSVFDKAGNSASTSFQINLESFPPLKIVASANPAANAAGWNNTPVTIAFECTGGAPPVSCPAPQTVSADGANQVITGTATDAFGNTAVASSTINLDQTAPLVSITSPADGSTTASTTVPVSGLTSDALSGLASITCNSVPATITGGSFNCTVQITQNGAVSVTVQATDVAGNTASANFAVNLQGPKVTITSPASLALFSANPITVAGTVDDPNSVVSVNGVQAANAGGNFTAQGVILREGNTPVTATATNAGGAAGTASVNVILDTTPPVVRIDSPSDKAILTSPQIYVTGLVNDVVSGTVNAAQVSVTINGVKADVANRSFMADGVLLVPGQNIITAVAKDRAGNIGQSSVTVTLQDTSTQQRILMVSGNGQSGVAGTTLAQPLIVQLVNSVGQPLPNLPVTFAVNKSDGALSAFPQQGRQLTLQTDANGQASLNFQLGTRAGNGNNQVLVTAPGFVGEVMFCSSATVGPPAQIHDISGGTQKGVIGQALPEAFVVGVFDAGGNPVSGVPVTFKVEQGGGTLDGAAATVTRATDPDGHVATVLALAQEEGINNNVVSAAFDQVAQPATLIASGLSPAGTAQTRVTGVVLDNANQPIPSVTASIQGTNFSALTDVNGQFTIQNAPVGSIVLFIDGATSTRPETFPFLEFPLVTIAGQNNNVGGPIYLPLLDVDNSKVVGGDEDVVLTMKGAPGVAYTVFAHSATFPDGSKVGRLTLSQVHGDKVPMAPPNGTSPGLVGTLQPARVKFDPPIRIQVPNSSALPSGQTVEVFSFDHDLEQFVSGGTARVSEDGSVIVSDPGFGLRVSGWHAAPPPPPPPTCASSCATKDPCKTGSCVNGACVFKPANEGGKCDDGSQECGAAACKAGACVPKNATDGKACDPKDKCVKDAKCQSGSCKGKPVDTKTFKDDNSIAFDAKVPASLVSRLNSLLGSVGINITFKEARVGAKGRVRDCCNKDTGIQTNGVKEGSAQITLTADVKNLSLPALSFPSISKEFDFGIAIISIDFALGVELSTSFRINAEGGIRGDACKPETCGFGEINASLDPELKLTAEAIGCIETLWTTKHCGGITITPAALRLSFRVGASFNKPNCDSGLKGVFALGRLVFRAEFQLDVPKSPRRLVFERQIFGGSSAGL